MNLAKILEPNNKKIFLFIILLIVSEFSLYKLNLYSSWGYWERETLCPTQENPSQMCFVQGTALQLDNKKILIGTVALIITIYLLSSIVTHILIPTKKKT